MSESDGTRYKNGILKKIPWSKWFGTFPAMVDIVQTTPQDVHPQATMTLFHRKHKLDNVFMTDLWPAATEAFWIIGDPVCHFFIRVGCMATGC